MEKELRYYKDKSLENYYYFKKYKSYLMPVFIRKLWIMKKIKQKNERILEIQINDLFSRNLLWITYNIHIIYEEKKIEDW